MRRRTLTRSEIAAMAASIAALLADPDAGPTPTTRARWEGALTACEVILGGRPTLPADEIADAVTPIL